MDDEEEDYNGLVDLTDADIQRLSLVMPFLSMAPGDLKRWVDSQFSSTVSCYDFSSMLTWPFSLSFAFSRLRVCCPVAGAELHKLQAYTRDLENGLQLERESFTMLSRSVLAHRAMFPKMERTIMSNLARKLAAKMGEGILDNMDPHGIQQLRKHFVFEIAGQYRMPDFMKQVVIDCEMTEKSMSPNRITTLNAALAMLANIGFVSSYHFSVAKRYYYTYHFEFMLQRAFDLATQPIASHSATVLFASSQADVKKRKLILQKCGTTQMTPEEIEQVENILKPDFQVSELQRFMDVVSYIPDAVEDIDRLKLIKYLSKNLITDPAVRQLFCHDIYAKLARAPFNPGTGGPVAISTSPYADCDASSSPLLLHLAGGGGGGAESEPTQIAHENQ